MQSSIQLAFCVISFVLSAHAFSAEIDPFADNSITCDEMRKYPQKVFTGPIDLGSGMNSPMDVDFTCEESLASLPFLKSILQLAEKIRGNPKDRGTIIHAQNRVYQFALTEAGFVPNDSPRDTSHAHFRKWSNKSSYNLKLYKAFMSEFNAAKPKLAKHYQSKFKLSKQKSENATKQALMIVMERAAGPSTDSLSQRS